MTHKNHFEVLQRSGYIGNRPDVNDEEEYDEKPLTIPGLVAKSFMDDDNRPLPPTGVVFKTKDGETNLNLNTEEKEMPMMPCGITFKKK